VSWARYGTPLGTAGFDVRDICHNPGCDAGIDRGLAHLCGDRPGESSEFGCGRWFCLPHLALPPPGLAVPFGTVLCASCASNAANLMSAALQPPRGGQRGSQAALGLAESRWWPSRILGLSVAEQKRLTYLDIDQFLIQTSGERRAARLAAGAEGAAAAAAAWLLARRRAARLAALTRLIPRRRR
jgi:hypothetical protein